MENFLFGIINMALSFIFYGVAIIFIYRLGFNDAMSVKNGDKELKNVFLSEKTMKKMDSLQEQRINTLIENIDNYNGSGQGQKEVI